MPYVRKLFYFIVLALLVVSGLPAPAFATEGCTLCIVEVQMQGLQGQEDQDMVVIANVGMSNVTASTAYPILLTYSTDDGRAVQSAVITKTLGPGQVFSFVSSGELALRNPTATTLPFAIYSGGGSLRLSRSTNAGTAVYDTVGWGTASRGFEGQAFVQPERVLHIQRRQYEGVRLDTGNNADDFEPYVAACKDIALSEIQPLVADAQGQAVDSWLELKRANEDIACYVLTANNQLYFVPTDMLPPQGELGVVSYGYDDTGNIVPLNLGGSNGEVIMLDQSTYGEVHIPVVSSGKYQGLQYGQTWAVIDGRWKKAIPTPGSDNVVTDSSMATQCSGVHITEVLPNPADADADNEWIELHNESAEPVSLRGCNVAIADVTYMFGPNDILAPDEWREYRTLYNADGTEQPISLRNSGETMVSLCGQTLGGSCRVLQSFIYADAPEGQSYARFADGWQWVKSLTPGSANSLHSDGEGPTEGPAVASPSSSVSAAVPEGALSITELLPNPAAPGTDDHDEFIEIWNSSDEPVALMGMKLQTGNSYSYSYTLTDQVVSPRGYVVTTSAESKLTLSNTSGRARIITSDGVVVAEVDPYDGAPEGQSWAMIDGAWKWTATPTPGAANIYLPAVTAFKSTGASKKTTTSAAMAKPKATAATPSATKAAKTTKSSPASSTKKSVATVATISPLHPAILAGVGALAVLYAGYEYRQDIALRVYQFRRYRAARRSARSNTQGR